MAIGRDAIGRNAIGRGDRIKKAAGPEKSPTPQRDAPKRPPPPPPPGIIIPSVTTEVASSPGDQRSHVDAYATGEIPAGEAPPAPGSDAAAAVSATPSLSETVREAIKFEDTVEANVTRANAPVAGYPPKNVAVEVLRPTRETVGDTIIDRFASDPSGAGELARALVVRLEIDLEYFRSRRSNSPEAVEAIARLQSSLTIAQTLVSGLEGAAPPELSKDQAQHLLDSLLAALDRAWGNIMFRTSLLSLLLMACATSGVPAAAITIVAGGAVSKDVLEQLTKLLKAIRN